MSRLSCSLFWLGSVSNVPAATSCVVVSLTSNGSWVEQAGVYLVSTSVCNWQTLVCVGRFMGVWVSVRVQARQLLSGLYAYPRTSAEPAAPAVLNNMHGATHITVVEFGWVWAALQQPGVGGLYDDMTASEPRSGLELPSAWICGVLLVTWAEVLARRCTWRISMWSCCVLLACRHRLLLSTAPTVTPALPIVEHRVVAAA
jgi:hypothetical protein